MARAAVGEPARFGFWRRAVDHWLAVSQYGFPFAVGRYATPIGRVRALARRARAMDRPPLLRFLVRGLMAATWPLGAFATALKTRNRMRRDAKPAGSAVFLDMYWLALRHSIPPLEYELYGFTDPARRAQMHEYIYWNDLAALAVLNRRRGADNRDVQDKNRFALICAAHGLPHIETLAVFERGRQTVPAMPFVPQTEALWSKPLSLRSGARGNRWHWRDGCARDESGCLLSLEAFRIELAKQDTIVQPLVENHPVIARLSNGGLAVLRVLTGMNPAGEAEKVATVLVLPHGRHATTIGGLICSLESGRIRKAGLLDGKTVQYHPDTGAVLTGFDIPFFQESVALACRAHAQAFSRFAFLGWDVVLTADGPLLLETNSGWGAIIHQALDGPLGNTAFSRLAGQYV